MMCSDGEFRFFRHVWGLWKEESRLEITKQFLSTETKIKKGYMYIQVRTCERCGFTQRKTENMEV